MAVSILTALRPFPLIALSLAMRGSGVPLFAMGVITSAWIAAIPPITFAKELDGTR